VHRPDGEAKAGLRRHFLERRLGIGARVVELGERAQSSLIGHPAFGGARAVMVYIPFRGEVPTERIIAACLSQGKTVTAPVTLRTERRLLPLRVSGNPGELRPGEYGISEPDPDRCEPFPPEFLDLVVIPGVAFDERGGRLGYGGGYYDRFLEAEAPAALRAALAFETQLSSVPLPLGDHDTLMDFIFTEARVIQGGRARPESRR